jgi:hypothetical protein
MSHECHRVYSSVRKASTTSYVASEFACSLQDLRESVYTVYTHTPFSVYTVCTVRVLTQHKEPNNEAARQPTIATGSNTMSASRIAIRRIAAVTVPRISASAGARPFTSLGETLTQKVRPVLRPLWIYLLLNLVCVA